jgi:hypothetical protein
VGWMLAAAAFLPVGRIFDEVSAASADAAATPPPDDILAFRASHDLAGGLSLSRQHTTVPETPVQLVWENAVQRCGQTQSQPGSSRQLSARSPSPCPSSSAARAR